MVALRLAAFGLVVATVLPLVPAPQEPAPEPAPKPAPAAKPDDAAKTVPGSPVRHPLEGVYELRRRRVNGLYDDRPSRGYVAITQRHVFLCFAGPGVDADHPLLRSGVRTWTPPTGASNAVDAVVQLGWFTDAEGRVHVETPGTKETRRMVLERGLLRISQDDRNELEFERVE